ncbi:Uncharacterised protein [uncultured archaeon]|nr:Uncharacterised protein [uncultured archaeon]
MAPQFLKWIDQNCTKCAQFKDIALKTDENLVMWFEQKINLSCAVHGIIQNNKLYVCSDFVFDTLKPEIVYNERRATKHYQRFFVRIGTPIPCDVKREKVIVPDSIDGLTWSIYDLVQKVYIEHGMSSLLTFVVSRINIEKGYSKETIFKCVMSMIENGYLVRSQAGKFVELMLPPVDIPIADVLKIGKKKVLA